MINLLMVHRKSRHRNAPMSAYAMFSVVLPHSLQIKAVRIQQKIHDASSDLFHNLTLLTSGKCKWLHFPVMIL